MATQEELDNWFTYHAPTPEQIFVYQNLREWAKGFAQAFNDAAPECADKTAAMRKLRDTLMAMNLAIACNGGDLPRRRAADLRAGHENP